MQTLLTREDISFDVRNKNWFLITS